MAHTLTVEKKKIIQLVPELSEASLRKENMANLN